MIVALSGGQKAGLLAVAAVFIVFALVSAFLLPRSNPDFPGRRLPLFVAITVLLFLGMITAVLALARESEEEGHAAEPAAAESGTHETQTEAAARGDAAAGKEVFASAGCGGCHTLVAAGSSGAVGPNLDDVKPAFDKVVTQVTNGGGGMPPFKGQLSAEQIRNVAAFVSESAGS